MCVSQVWTPPKIEIFGFCRTLGHSQRDSCMLGYLEWGVCVSPFFFFSFYKSPPTIGFLLGVIGHLGV